MQPVNRARWSGETTTFLVGGRGCIISALIYSQFCSILCPLKPSADHSWQTPKYFTAESPVTTNTRIFCHGELPFIPSHRQSFLYCIPEEKRYGRLKNLEQQTCLDQMLLLKMLAVCTVSFGAVQIAQTINQTCPYLFILRPDPNDIEVNSILLTVSSILCLLSHIFINI